MSVIFTDAKQLPSSVTIPYSANTIQTKVLNTQIDISLPTKKRLWSAVVSAKILNQSKVLELCGGDGTALREIAKNVASGDPKNLEAYAARIYWRRLFGEEFRRDRDAADENALLNYGYAVVRAATARAIVGTGLHPGLGINHKNQYNPLPLADDLVEPLRPMVDMRVHSIIREMIPDADGSEKEIILDRDTKREILGVIADECLYDGRKMPMMVALGNYTATIKQVMMGEADKPVIPTFAEGARTLLSA